MTGSGTSGDPYVISDVDDLQDMEDDTDAYYELGGNIDASATSSWNGGAGFDPVGNTITTYYTYITPSGDLRIEGTQIGTYPDDGNYSTKVDDAVDSPDDDTTYNYNNVGNEAWFVYGTYTPDTIPADAYDIGVRLYIRTKHTGTNKCKGVIRINDTDYVTDDYIIPDLSYSNKYWTIATNPDNNGSWDDNIAVLNAGIQGIGTYHNYGNGSQRVTQCYLRISYKLDLRFKGTFDGNGYTISDLYINRPTEGEVGLFGCVNGATIQDVTLADVDITGDDDVGGLVGDFSDGAISNITVTNASVTGTDCTGGVAGYTGDSTVADCSSSGSINGQGPTGGIIGWAGSVCTISSCHSSCLINTTPNEYWGEAWMNGGLIGSVNSGTVTNCYSTGNVSVTGVPWYGENEDIGGLIGYLSSNSTLSESYATGNVSAEYSIRVGGLLGYLYIRNGTSGSVSNCYARGSASTTNSPDIGVGGLIGSAYAYTVGTGSITNCYSTGLVTPPESQENGGGLIGYNYQSTITSCYWDTQTSGQATSDGGTGKTTAEMKTLSTFDDVGWDIGGEGIDRNNGYPYLHWETGGATPIWQIYDTGYRSWTIPDLLDYKGRAVKNARVEAYRVDTHALVETQITDENGSATFTQLPNDVDVVFHATWGGTASPRTTKTFYM